MFARLLLPHAFIAILFAGCLGPFPKVHLWPLLLDFSDSSGSYSRVAGPAFTNVRNGGLVETGLLRGTNSVDADRIEVSIDGGAYTTASGTSSFTYALPTGSAIWRDGSVHTVTARSVRGGLYSQETSLTLKKGKNRDFNGDGYPDLAVGAAGYNSSQGRVYIFYSGGATGIAATAAGSADVVLTGGCAGDIYGDSIAQGDFNGDGYADLAVGAFGYSCANARGRVYIYQSGGTSGIPTSATHTIDGATNADRLGTALASGDINGDGYADLIAGAERVSTSQGAAYIFHGASSGITQALGAATRVITGASAFDEFGSAASTGDFNGDGFADLAVGAIRYNAGTNQGAVYIFHANNDGTGISPTTAGGATVRITGQSGNDDFSTSLATGDFDNNGYADLIVGANRYSSNGGTGRAYIFSSSGSSGITITTAATATRIITGESANDEFGARVATGDFNGDGYVDAVVSARSYPAGNAIGRFYIFSSSSSGITATLAGSATTIITGASNSDQFSAFAPVHATDLNGDGYPDLIAGAGGAAGGTGDGRLYVFHSGGSNGIVATATASAATTISGSGGEYFGDKITN
ncbi:MAG: FG-GAP repeat protein [Spirochaetales bacterium]|nr:FG-GAP repeat protein [Spirochaetales bacterium]